MPSREGLRYWPNNVQLLHARALSLKTAGDPEGAREALAALSRQHPDNTHTWQGWAQNCLIVSGFGYWFSGSKFMVYGLGCMVYGVGFRVYGLGSRA